MGRQAKPLGEMTMAGHNRTRLLVGAAMAAGGLMAIASPAAAKDCAALAGAALPQGKVTAATLVPAGGFKPAALPGAPPGVQATGFAKLPAFCRIEATLTPSADS